MKILSFLILIFLFNSSHAIQTGSVTGLELPRYVSLKSYESNIRVGPSKNYPINIRYIVENYPLRIIDEHKDWRKVEDFQNNIGWIHKSLIKSDRNGIIISDKNNNIIVYDSVFEKIIGEIEKGSIIQILKCKSNWCFIKKNGHKGWVEKKNIWGVRDKEVFNLSYFQMFIDLYFRSINFIEFYIIR